MEIWLDTNIKAHSFVDRSCWEAAFDDVRRALPSSELYMYRDHGEIKGFIGISAGHYIEGLFVSERYQSQGIGRKLIEYCKKLYPRLALHVFVRNQAATRFYSNNGFQIVEEMYNESFGYGEYKMIWEAFGGN